MEKPNMDDISLQSLARVGIKRIILDFVEESPNARALTKDTLTLYLREYIHTYIQTKRKKEKNSNKKAKKKRANHLPIIYPVGTGKQLYPLSFLTLWAIHSKGPKKASYRLFRKINPNNDLLEEMTATLKLWVGSDQWSKGFPPHLRTWLYDAGWENPPTTPDNGWL